MRWTWKRFWLFGFGTLARTAIVVGCGMLTAWLMPDWNIWHGILAATIGTVCANRTEEKMNVATCGE